MLGAARTWLYYLRPRVRTSPCTCTACTYVPPCAADLYDRISSDKDLGFVYVVDVTGAVADRVRARSLQPVAGQLEWMPKEAAPRPALSPAGLPLLLVPVGLAAEAAEAAAAAAAAAKLSAAAPAKPANEFEAFKRAQQAQFEQFKQQAASAAAAAAPPGAPSGSGSGSGRRDPVVIVGRWGRRQG